MKIKSLTIQNFKSFQEEQTFNFESINDSTFNYIYGENLKDPKLGANGSGKSTIIDALMFVFFGKTAENLKASNIVNWKKGKNLKVTSTFELQGIEYFLVRTWKPNSLQLNKRDIDQKEIIQLLGLDARTFLHTVVISQFSTRFFDLSPSEKLQIFSEILELDRWVSYSEKAKKISKEFDADISDVEKKIEFLKGQLLSIEDIDYSKESDKWKDDIIQKIRVLQEDNTLKIEELEKCTKDHEEAEEVLKEIEVIKKNKMEEAQNLQIPYDDLIEKIQEIKISSKTKETEIKALEKQIRKFESVELECPYCEQEVSDKYIKSYISRFSQNIEEIRLEIKQLEQDKDDLEVKKLELSKVLSDLESVIAEVDIEIKDCKKVLTEVVYKLDSYESVIEKNKQSIKSLKEAKNPFNALMQENKQKIKDLRIELEEKDKNIEKLQKEKSLNNFWIKGFKDVRLYIVKEALKEFEIRINDILRDLGMSDWCVELDIDSENKTGGIKKGFTVLVKSPLNEDLVSFECWSGGERQRLKLAGTLALMDLISNRTNVNFNIEIFDEPTTWMNEEGIENLLQILKERSGIVRKQIFLIDHRNLKTSGVFDNIIKIVKDDNGSKIDFEI